MDNIAVNISGWEALKEASFLVQLTLLILISLSIVCWGVALSKFQQFKNLKNANLPFMHLFEKTNSLDQIYDSKDRFAGSNLARLFIAGFDEMKKLAESKNNSNSKDGLAGIDNIERVLRKQMDTEIAILESRINWLATTGSTGPFIGLFGTVWGIMTSFHKIGQMGSASLAVVAPGISEALIATAIGLLAAIPSVMLYNYFISQIKKEEMNMNNFSIDFINAVKRDFFKS